MLRSLIKGYSHFDLIRCILSAGLLAFAFPQLNLWICAWGGLVPLMFVLYSSKFILDQFSLLDMTHVAVTPPTVEPSAGLWITRSGIELSTILVYT